MKKKTYSCNDDSSTCHILISNRMWQRQKGYSTEGGAASLSGTLTFAIWDNNLNDFIESNDMVGKFQEKYPNIDIEVEKIKDDSEYWNTMKMRASANQLPDVMFNKNIYIIQI